MTLWQTVIVVVYMAGVWSTFKSGMERMLEVQLAAEMNRPVHPMSMMFHRVFYANVVQVILTALLWPITMFIGIAMLLGYYLKYKRSRK